VVGGLLGEALDAFSWVLFNTRHICFLFFSSRCSCLTTITFSCLSGGCCRQFSYYSCNILQKFQWLHQIHVLLDTCTVNIISIKPPLLKQHV
jgi:hypothetical protein